MREATGARLFFIEAGEGAGSGPQAGELMPKKYSLYLRGTGFTGSSFEPDM